MSSQDWDRCKQILCDALEVPKEERTILVDRACGANTSLREQVFAMLAAAEDDSSPLDVGAAEQVVENLRPAEPVTAGDIVGRYRVLRLIGQGGTSLVYLAEHADLRSPRRFAIKVIASAFIAGRQERFERECEILAAVEHPNIARIIDKGVTDSGWPYLVMDYIEGAPFHRYCIEHKLAPPEIVRLMLDCCAAVKYMHTKLIVHCDLKPSNILVDATRSPRILDFGISKIIEPSRQTRTGKTTRGVRPLTPDYASPEQLAGLPLTASTDIYSLGVVLYESLTGSLPFDNSGYPWPQISKKIAEDDPLPPSKARIKAASTREGIAFARNLRGDLDSIVLKAMVHNPAKRYGSMDDLGADLNRYLAGEVVKARRSTITNRVSKLLRRHPRGIVEFLSVGVAVVLTIWLSSWNAQIQRRDRDAQYLDELRSIVNTLAFPEDLPSSARARGMLAERVSTIVDSVAPAVSLHPELIPDLGDALLRACDLFGNPYNPSLGSMDEARKCYQRVFELVNGRTDARSVDLRARASLGFGDTYSHPAMTRDPWQAANWYSRALSEISPRGSEFRNTAAVAHGRMGMICELLGCAGDARFQYGEGLLLTPPETESKHSLDFALTLERARMEPPEVRGASYAEVIKFLDPPKQAESPKIRTYLAAIEAHLSMGAAELQPEHLTSAEMHFASAAELAGQIVARDPGDLQARRELALALRRSALIPEMKGRIAESDALRASATEMLRSSMASPTGQETAAESSCPGMNEQVSKGQFPQPMGHGDLLIANGLSSGIPGTLLVFSPGARELSVLAEGGYLSDITDVAYASRTELYVVDRGLAGSGGIVRLKYQAGHWLQKPVTCGGLLRRPAALVYYDKRLILADADDYSARLIGIDLQSGQQTVLGRGGTFTEPGKIIRALGGDLLLSLFWPGEAGPAEIRRFNADTGKFSVAARYGLLQNPVALALTPRGDLLAGDRGWIANSRHGGIFRIRRDHSQQIVCQNPELSRVNAIAVASDRQVWYVTAAAPFTAPGLFELDLATCRGEQVLMRGSLLVAPRALVHVY